MKILVLGTGKIGRQVVREVAQQAEVERVGIADVDDMALDEAQRLAGSDKIKRHKLEQKPNAQTTLHLREQMKQAMEEYDVGIITLPNRQVSYLAVETAIEVGLNIVDILEEYHRRPDPQESEGLQALLNGMSFEAYGEQLHQRALANNVLVLDGMGFAPGLSNITLGEGIRQMDEAHSAISRVGGIPAKRFAMSYPLRYMITWSFEHVLREYMVPVEVIKEGQRVLIEALSDREQFHFTELGQDEMLECAITPGMPSFVHTRASLREFAEKTIRWPGHWDAIQTLRECGLLDDGALRKEDKGASEPTPREFFRAIVEPKLRQQAGHSDVCIMWNTVQGVKDGQPTRLDYYLWEEANVERGISAMARVTAFPATIAALLIGRGEIAHQGIVPPEDAISGATYETFIAELARRGIHIKTIQRRMES